MDLSLPPWQTLLTYYRTKQYGAKFDTAKPNSNAQSKKKHQVYSNDPD